MYLSIIININATKSNQFLVPFTTLIDDIFVSLNLYKKFASSILINDMTDHLPILTLLRQTKLNNINI